MKLTETCDWCGRVREGSKIAVRANASNTGIVYECVGGCKPGTDSWLQRFMSTPIDELLHGKLYDPVTRACH